MPGEFSGDDMVGLGIDPNSPAVQFLGAVVDAFFGEGAPEDPEQIKARIDAVIAQRPLPPRQLGVTAAEQATALVEAAWEADDDSALELPLDALRLWPDCADAYVFLGTHAADAPELAIPLFTLGVVAGYATIEAQVQMYAGRLWQLEEAQPFMQALLGLARANRDAGGLDVAVMHFLELLQLDQDDPLHARYELLAIYLLAQDRQGVHALAGAFPEESSAVWRYGLALDAFQRLGDGGESRAALSAATASNPHLAAYLLETEPLPDQVDPELAPGSRDEAAVYADLLGPAWQATRNALGWMRAQGGLIAVPPKAAPPPKERRSGPREI